MQLELYLLGPDEDPARLIVHLRGKNQRPSGKLADIYGNGKGPVGGGGV